MLDEALSSSAYCVVPANLIQSETLSRLQVLGDLQIIAVKA